MGEHTTLQPFNCAVPHTAIVAPHARSATMSRRGSTKTPNGTQIAAAAPNTQNSQINSKEPPGPVKARKARSKAAAAAPASAQFVEAFSCHKRFSAQEEQVSC
jgi:hypothetical protein